ncbi:hypothetical protein FACS1894151_06140 [Spirochaetia bacterium]|nr:hypothetical protein FACS1894151_06140 [Spirochaetia bacterium]
MKRTLVTKRIKCFLTLFVLLAAVPVFGQTGSQSALEIIRSSRNRIQSQSQIARARMVITAKNGSETVMIMDQFSKDSPNGIKRSVVSFPDSEDGRTLNSRKFANTRFLTIQTPGQSDNRRIYLPELRRVRTIAAGDGGESFLGTDFSYDDISSASRNADLDNHTLVREENYNGKACYVIESRPKDSSFAYGLMRSWIDKSASLLYKIEIYNRSGTMIKILEMSDYRNVQGRLTAIQTKIATLETGSSTTITMERIRYDVAISDSLFTDNYLLTGRY